MADASDVGAAEKRPVSGNERPIGRNGLQSIQGVRLGVLVPACEIRPTGSGSEAAIAAEKDFQRGHDQAAMSGGVSRQVQDVHMLAAKPHRDAFDEPFVDIAEVGYGKAEFFAEDVHPLPKFAIVLMQQNVADRLLA